MTAHIIYCPESEEPRSECSCSKCSEYRAALDELRRDRDDEDWNRRAASRRIDQEYVRRRM